MKQMSLGAAEFERKTKRTHIGGDADSGLVHTVATTAANAHDITQAHELLHGEETDIFADSGYRGVEK